MNKNFSRVSKYFKVEKLKDKNRIMVFLVCLSIATTLWLFNALSKDYTATVSYPVKFINSPANRFMAEKTPERLDLLIAAQGFTLLRFKLLPFIPVKIDVGEITKNVETTSGTFNVNSRNLIPQITEQLNGEIKISNIDPEVITIVLDSLASKTVPVELDVNVQFEPQFNLKSPITTVPKEVKITGPAILLRKITVLKTKVNVANKVNSSIEQEIELIHPEKTTTSPDKVTLFVDVEKYTEKELKIPITILNKPKNAQVKLFPSELKVVFTVGLSRFENIKTSDFGASVDYSKIVDDVNNLAVELYKKPEFIQDLRIVPEKVEFLIEAN
jgi:hypothetical protein